MYGQSVFVNTINQIGIVLELPKTSDKVYLQVGNSKMYFPVSQLSYAEVKPEKQIDFSKNTIQKSAIVNTELNVIGLNVLEATPIVDKYLDDAALAGLTTVRIIHGRGTGKLREGIQSFLKTHPHVKNYRVGTFGEGEMGVTIVELK